MPQGSLHWVVGIIYIYDEIFKITQKLKKICILKLNSDRIQIKHLNNINYYNRGALVHFNYIFILSGC